MMKFVFGSLMILCAGFGIANAQSYIKAWQFGAPAVTDTNAVVAPQAGDIAFQTLDDTFRGFNGASWVELGASGSVTSVTARYLTNTGSIANNTVTTVDYGTVDYDSNSAVTTGSSWAFTAPQAGVYRVSAALAFSGVSTTTGQRTELYIYKNGTLHSIIGVFNAQATITQRVFVAGTDSVNMSASDTISIRVWQNFGGWMAIDTTNPYNYVAIERVP